MYNFKKKFKHTILVLSCINSKNLKFENSICPICNDIFLSSSLFYWQTNFRLDVKVKMGKSCRVGNNKLFQIIPMHRGLCFL